MDGGKPPHGAIEPRGREHSELAAIAVHRIQIFVERLAATL